ncbi:H-2 class II histocompatibility antigen, I-A beta chain isoform X2 [Maylandia zebra]|uniref:H-2 class II histocompatibility antigen, I-A beta chain isoform X2 n=1 Tax=Maylandia zebra TaxID=106582 RepID=UPI00403C37BA
MHIRCTLLLTSVFLLFSRADAYFGYGVVRCLFTSKDDVVYLAQLYFNKVLQEQEKKNEQKCRTNVPLVFDVLSRPVEPTVKLRLAESPESEHPGMLMCSAYNFYPKQIKLTWLRDGKEATSNVTSTDELPNGNWLYQIHSYLEIIPKPGENISCMVEHASLMEPKFYDWDPTSEAEKNKIAIGVAGLLLGLVFVLGGAVFYKRNTTSRILVPTS